MTKLVVAEGKWVGNWGKGNTCMEKSGLDFS